MFESLGDRLCGIFDGLTKRGALSEADVSKAMREVRVALLEADVALPVVKGFVGAVAEKAVGREVLGSVTPGQMVVKIVHDHLVETLGRDGNGINLAGTPPVAVLMVGLQGAGKTTTTAKLGLRFKTKEKKKVLMASLDVYRPAAQQQLRQLGAQVEVDVLPVILGEKPVAIAGRAMDAAAKSGCDVVLLDTAGRLHVDSELMSEVSAIRDIVKPVETLLVADAMTGQDAVNVARAFDEKIGVTGIVLTRVDGDAHGGAALSMRVVTGKPIKVMGVGEKMDQLEAFHANRVAGRILGMGDIVGLVEKAQETVEREEAEKLAKRAMRGLFTLEDMNDQLTQLLKMGDMRGLMGMLPGVGKIKNRIGEANIDDRTIARQQAVIRSMTKDERLNPKKINGSRRKRIAAGCGQEVSDVNRLLKQHRRMSDMMRKMGKLGKKSMGRGGIDALFGGGTPPGFPLGR